MTCIDHSSPQHSVIGDITFDGGKVTQAIESLAKVIKERPTYQLGQPDVHAAFHPTFNSEVIVKDIEVPPTQVTVNPAEVHVNNIPMGEIKVSLHIWPLSVLLGIFLVIQTILILILL